MNGLILGQCILDLLDALMKGVAALPFLLALALVMGRRAHGLFCLFGAIRLGRFTLLLSLGGIITIPVNFVLQMAAINGHDYITTFFSKAAMHFSVTLGIWILGILVLFMAIKALKQGFQGLPRETVQSGKYTLKAIRSGFWLDILAAFLFFLTFASSHWPFGGFPDQISPDRVIMAILRNTARNFFMALAPAGALACVLAIYTKKREKFFSDEQFDAAIRWCSVWGFIGYLPHCLQYWGIVLGAAARSAGIRAQELGLFSQAVGLLMLTGGLLCFAFILFRKHFKNLLAFIGLGLFLCSVPVMKIYLALSAP